MASYRQGTVAVTNGSKIVTGTDTAFITTGIYAGDIFALVDANNIPDGTLYEVASVESDTKLTLLQAYQGTTGSAKGYVIMNMAGNQTTPRFAAQVSKLLSEVQPISDALSDESVPAGIPQAGSDGKLARNWLPVFTGASSDAAGQQGAVPAPTATSQPLYLLSNGAWARGAPVTFVGDTGIDLNSYINAGQYAFLTGAVSSGSNFPSAASGVLEVYGNNAGQLYQRYTDTSRNIYIRQGADTGVFADWRKISFVAAPQTAEGPGQWVTLSAEVNEALNLPSGGTWAWLAQRYTSANAPSNAVTGVSAGGSVIVSDSSIYKIRGFAWRIA